ncbi:MAG: SDR family oxidoreductase [Beijerinckiaceae bacterium]|jgi:NADP-dependent 3-hydroxy acid dehydrogenase YdfG|nr:SDR family oxidoreductase [Beijerinckiaceae bacterium]
MGKLEGKTIWITGAGSGIGEATAHAMAKEGATVALTGRRKEPLETVAHAITQAGGKALVEPGDVMDKAMAPAVVARIIKATGRLDILVNNAGTNVTARTFAVLTPENLDTVLQANLNGAYYCVLAVLPQMRAQQDGVLIHTASWAGKYVTPLSGTAYTASKHAVVAMSHSLNMEEFKNGIRSSVICPHEISTPILNTRPVKVTEEERARMLQSEDMANLYVYIATQPAHVCINEVTIAPTWNRAYLHGI